jgi:hypothetical protein
VGTSAEPGRTPRSARHRAPRRPEKRCPAGDSGIAVARLDSSPAPAGTGMKRPTRGEEWAGADWRGRGRPEEADPRFGLGSRRTGEQRRPRWPDRPRRKVGGMGKNGTF